MLASTTFPAWENVAARSFFVVLKDRFPTKTLNTGVVSAMMKGGHPREKKDREREERGF